MTEYSYSYSLIINFIKNQILNESKLEPTLPIFEFLLKLKQFLPDWLQKPLLQVLDNLQLVLLHEILFFANLYCHLSLSKTETF